MLEAAMRDRKTAASGLATPVSPRHWHRLSQRAPCRASAMNWPPSLRSRPPPTRLTQPECVPFSIATRMPRLCATCSAIASTSVRILPRPTLRPHRRTRTSDSPGPRSMPTPTGTPCCRSLLLFLMLVSFLVPRGQWGSYDTFRGCRLLRSLHSLRFGRDDKSWGSPVVITTRGRADRDDSGSALVEMKDRDQTVCFARIWSEGERLI